MGGKQIISLSGLTQPKHCTVIHSAMLCPLRLINICPILVTLCKYLNSERKKDRVFVANEENPEF